MPIHRKSIQEEVANIKQGKPLILGKNNNDLLIGSLYAEGLLEKLKPLLIHPNALPPITVYLGEYGQLYDHINNIPELTWDLLDYAEAPLELIFANGKNLPAMLLGPTHEIRIMMPKHPDLLNLLKQHKKPLFGLKWQDYRSSPEPAPNRLETDVTDLLNPKVMRLENDGTFAFL